MKHKIHPKIKHFPPPRVILIHSRITFSVARNVIMIGLLLITKGFREEAFRYIIPLLPKSPLLKNSKKYEEAPKKGASSQRNPNYRYSPPKIPDLLAPLALLGL